MTRENIKLVCFDLNKTLIKENSWRNLNIVMGVPPEVDDLLMQWGSQEILNNDAEGQQLLLRMFQKSGVHKYENINAALKQYSYKKGAKKIVRYLKDASYELAIISGSMDILVEHVADELDIPHYGANNLFLFDEKDYLHDIVTIANDTNAKLYQLAAICRKLGIDLTQCACVGDGDNEIEIFKKTGRGITFANSPIEEHAWKVIKSLPELKEIL